MGEVPGLCVELVQGVVAVVELDGGRGDGDVEATEFGGGLLVGDIGG